MCKPKGNIIEGYIFDEALGLCTKYMERFGATRKCVWDAYEEERVAKEVLEGISKSWTLCAQLWNATHLYVC